MTYCRIWQTALCPILFWKKRDCAVLLIAIYCNIMDIEKVKNTGGITMRLVKGVMAGLLALIMTLSLMPQTVFAEETTDSQF